MDRVEKPAMQKLHERRVLGHQENGGECAGRSQHGEHRARSEAEPAGGGLLVLRRKQTLQEMADENEKRRSRITRGRIAQNGSHRLTTASTIAAADSAASTSSTRLENAASREGID